MKNKAFIFDLDGTLLKTDTLIMETFKYVFKKYKPGYTLSNEELLSFLGPSLHDTFVRYFDESMVDELIEYYRDWNHKHHEDYVTIYPTVIDTIKTLNEDHYPLGVVTSKLKEAAYIGLDLFDLTKYFDVIIGHDDVNNGKPDPEGINKAMSILSVDDAVYVGDNITDIKAGKNAGTKTVAVKWSPKGYQAMADLHPDLLIDSMDEILKFVEE